MKSRKWDPLICLVLAAVLMIFVLELKNTNPMARVYPAVILSCCYLMIALTLIQWFINWKKGNVDTSGGIPKNRVVYIVVYCLVSLVYIILIDKLGYIPSTILFGIFSLMYMKCKNKVVIIVLPIVATFLMYFIFSNFLFVTLPQGILRGIL